MRGRISQLSASRVEHLHAQARRLSVARVVVAGIDGITGANLAAWLGEHHQVCGFSFSRPIAIEGCDTRVCPTDDPQAVHSAVQDARPEWLIYCGPAAESAWCGAAM